MPNVVPPAVYLTNLETMGKMEKIIGGPLTFARLMSSFRLCEGWSMAEMAEKLGVSRSHVNDVEKGRKAVSPARAAEWARKLGYGESLFVRLALQDLLDETGLNMSVELRHRAKGRRKATNVRAA